MAAVEQRKTTSRSQDRNFRRQQDLVAHLSSTTIAFNQLKAQIRELFKDGRSFAEVVYQSPDISVLASYFNILHTFSLARRDSETRNLIKNQQKVLEAVDRDDIYTYPIRSVSLEDVNKLSRPLSLGHIGIINKFLRLNRIPYFPWIPVDKEAQPAMSVAMMLPALDVARPKEVVIPSVLEGLRDNMQAYLDYYLGFINPTHLDDDQSFQLYKVLAYMGRTLPMALGLYMPARLGVTPSSSMKLLLEKEVFGGSKLGWFAIRRDMESEIKHAFRKDGLPAAVQPYQHYNHHAD